METVLFNIFDLPMVMAIFVSLILASVLIISRQARSQYLWLASYFYSIALVEMDKLIFWNIPARQFFEPWIPIIFAFGKTIGLLVPVLLYLYIRGTNRGEKLFSCPDTVLLIIPAVGLALSWLLYHSLGDNPESYVPSNYHNIFFNRWFMVLLLCKYGLFIAFVVFFLKTHWLNSKKNISIKENPIIGTNLVFLGALCIYSVELIADLLAALKSNSALLDCLGEIHNYMVMIYVCLILVDMLRQDVFKSLQKAKRNNLTKQRSVSLEIKKIHELMLEHKYYLDAEITLESLAKKLKMPEYQLSAVLNKDFQKNFFDFINYYRTEHAKNLMSINTGESYSILDILYDSGFNSKSAFNRYFKKYTGITPSEYREKLKAEQ